MLWGLDGKRKLNGDVCPGESKDEGNGDFAPGLKEFPLSILKSFSGTSFREGLFVSTLEFMVGVVVSSIGKGQPELKKMLKLVGPFPMPGVFF